ncbi:MAG TPA: hypothetical protein ENH91_01145 [Leeuwenhoekiella sp.]|nr:hypothetical protein [Leeuwenhoekiella sp.]
MKKSGYFIFLFVNFFITQIGAQEFPPFINFLPQEYGAENQNWAISQGEDRHIYFGNNSGLLEYNGAQWKLYPSPNKTIIRAVHAKGNRVYTGSYMEFGFWERNTFGLLKYTSLSANMREPMVEDEHFWKIMELNDWIVFQSLHRIYLYNTQNSSYEIIDVGAPLTKIFNVRGMLYFQALGKGLYTIGNGRVQLVSDDELLREDVLIDVVQDEKLLRLITQSKGIFEWANGMLKKADISANKVLKACTIYSSLCLKDGRTAIGTISNGFYLLDQKGNITQNLTQQEGLANNTVLSLFEDEAGNIWLGLDNGISVINLNSPFSVYQDTSGKLGTVYCSAVYAGYIYLGTNQGLFYKERDSQDKFDLMPGTSGQVWVLREIDGSLFAGHNLGTLLVKGASAAWISRVQGTWDIKPIPSFNDLLLQGNYDGLYVLKKNNGNWQMRNKLKGFDISSRFFEITAAGNLLVSHEYKGVFLLEVDKDFDRVVDYKPLHNAAAGLKSSLSSFNDTILYTYERGVLSFSEANGFTENATFKKGIGEGALYVSGKLVPDDKNNKLWGFAKSGLVYFSLGNLDNRLTVGHIAFPAGVRRDMRGFENISSLGGDNYLLGGVGG